jgi:hypothetical protein
MTRCFDLFSKPLSRVALIGETGDLIMHIIAVPNFRKHS